MILSPKKEGYGSLKVIGHHAAKIWLLAAEYPKAYQCIALLFEILVIFLLDHGGRVPPGLIQHRLGLRELQETGHVQSTFLPIAYPALLFLAACIGRNYGPHGGEIATIVLQALLFLVIILLIRTLLQRRGSDRFATTAALLMGLYPPFLVTVNHVNDTNLAFFGLLIVLVTILQFKDRLSVWSALAAGSAMACAMTIRPNFGPFVILLLWAVWRVRLRLALPLLLSAVAALIIVYCSITGLIHGRPFFPQNGPYNLYAGFNPYSEDYLVRTLNAERSLIPDHADHGNIVQMDWSQQSDRPGIKDARDLIYREYYLKQTVAFIKSHPKQVVRLTLIKLRVFMSPTPDFGIPKNESRLKKIARKIAKSTILLVLPIWLGLTLYTRRKGLELNGVVIIMVILYILPFVLTNSDPRFRIAIEGFVMIDVAGMLYWLYQKKILLPSHQMEELPI